jgi:hypothetical protein
MLQWKNPRLVTLLVVLGTIAMFAGKGGGGNFNWGWG